MRYLLVYSAFLLLPAVAMASEIWRVGYNDVPPYTMKNDRGVAEGYAIDLITALAERRGAEIRFVHFENPGEVVDALAAGRVDLSVALVKTAEREEVAIFTVPYHSLRIQLYTLESNANDVTRRWPDGVTVGFSHGSYPSVVARRFPTAAKREAPSNSDLLFQLLEGDVEAAIYPDITFVRLLETIDTRKSFVPVGDPLENVPIHFAISRSLPQLAASLNDDMSAFIVTREFNEMQSAWFGSPMQNTLSHRRAAGLAAAVGAIVALAALFFHLRARRLSQKALIKVAEEKAEIEKRSAEQLRSRNSRLEKKMGELEELLYVVSHDLSSPLVSISGFSRNAIRAVQSGNSDKASEMLGRVEINVRGMSKLINGVLSVSRIGQEEMHVEEFQLSDVVKEIALRLDGCLQNKDVELISDMDATLATDKHLFSRALQNLVENAIKYGCQDGHGVVKILVDQTPEQLRIGVSDNGPGIPKHLQSRIFQMYRRLQNDDTGSGLGLSIVSKIVDRLNARVYVDPSTERGALFWLEFDEAKLAEWNCAA
jgi:signal transduction histidine kinase